MPIKPSRNQSNRFEYLSNYLQRKSDRRPTLSRIKTDDIATAKYVIPHESIAYDVYSILKCARLRTKSPK